MTGVDTGAVAVGVGLSSNALSNDGSWYR